MSRTALSMMIVATGFLVGCGDPQEGVPDFTVVADRGAVSSIPTVDQISPYDEALTVCEYRVRNRIEGSRSAPGPGALIRVAHWSVVSGKNQAEQTDTGEPREMKLTLLSTVPGIDKVYRRNDLDFDPEEKLYLDLSQSLASPDPPKQVRYDYRGPVSRRMQLYWLTRHQLRLVVIGNSHAGVGVDTRQFFQPDNERTPVALNLAVAGSELPLQRLIVETYLVDLPNLEWIVWGVSPRIFNENRSFDRREEIFTTSPGFLYDQSNRDTLWPADPAAKPMLAGALEDAVDHEIEPWGWSPANHRELPVPLTPDAKKKILSHCRTDQFRWSAEAWESFQHAVNVVTDRGIQLLLFTPPYHPLVQEAEAADFDGTGHADYRDLVTRLQTLAESNDRVRFLDIHHGGDHEFIHEDFANPDHLHESGAAKLTARLVMAVESTK